MLNRNQIQLDAHLLATNPKDLSEQFGFKCVGHPWKLLHTTTGSFDQHQQCELLTQEITNATSRPLNDMNL